MSAFCDLENIDVKTLAIIGGGAWGSALSRALAPRFAEVRIWVHEPDLAARMASSRMNDVFLHGVMLAENARPGSSLKNAVRGADVIVSVLPSHVVREVYEQMA